MQRVEVCLIRTGVVAAPRRAGLTELSKQLPHFGLRLVPRFIWRMASKLHWPNLRRKP
jgi:hypothetical protein